MSRFGCATCLTFRGLRWHAQGCAIGISTLVCHKSSLQVRHATVCSMLMGQQQWHIRVGKSLLPIIISPAFCRCPSSLTCAQRLSYSPGYPHTLVHVTTIFSYLFNTSDQFRWQHGIRRRMSQSPFQSARVSAVETTSGHLFLQNGVIQCVDFLEA